jgi:tetratricopeptide (TPR) repeat protein
MHRIMLALFLVMATTAAPLYAQVDTLSQADTLAADAKKLFEAKDYKLALDKYTQAYSTYPQAKFVFGIASCYEALGNLPRALDAYEMFNQYEPTKEILARIDTEIKKLKNKLSLEYGEVFIFSSPSTAQLIIDEISKQNVYQTPARRWLKEGEHAIYFQKEGCVPRELRIQVERGEHIYVYAGLKPQN